MFVIVPVLLRVLVPNISAPAPSLSRVKLLVPVTPPENVVVPEETAHLLPMIIDGMLALVVNTMALPIDKSPVAIA